MQWVEQLFLTATNGVRFKNLPLTLPLDMIRDRDKAVYS